MKNIISVALKHPLAIASVVIPATISSAWVIEFLGFPPCALCLYQRMPYYAGCALLALLFVTRQSAWIGIRTALTAALLLTFAVPAALGAFHAGVEFSWWQGPAGCSGKIDMSDFETMLKSIQSTRAVSCTTPALLIFGLSLSAWNFIISFGVICLLALSLARRGQIEDAKV